MLTGFSVDGVHVLVCYKECVILLSILETLEVWEKAQRCVWFHHFARKLLTTGRFRLLIKEMVQLRVTDGGHESTWSVTDDTDEVLGLWRKGVLGSWRKWDIFFIASRERIRWNPWPARESMILCIYGIWGEKTEKRRKTKHLLLSGAAWKFSLCFRWAPLFQTQPSKQDACHILVWCSSELKPWLLYCSHIEQATNSHRLHRCCWYNIVPWCFISLQANLGKRVWWILISSVSNSFVVWLVRVFYAEVKQTAH